MRVEDALGFARSAGVARLDAQLLLAHLLDRPRAWLLAHDDHMLGREQASELRAMVQRRADGEPLAYVIGEAEFCGLRLQLTSDALIPRPETELLVEWALEHLKAWTGSSPDVIDLGTGSGAAALAICQARPQARVCATDISLPALALARANGERLALPVEWLAGDWWNAVVGRRFALALSNPPYIAGNDIHLHSLHYEPRTALTPEGDGLDALRRIISGASRHLLSGATLLLEHGHDQAIAVQDLFTSCRFTKVQTRMDLAGLPRCTGATWPGDP